ncbi:Ig-like domain-containing protein, partial [Candidatus Ozemobacteraceae bacterium]|nr:Ig-like domain-containing protein [Candidatus Ozemobacteraceae bacterium]
MRERNDSLLSPTVRFSAGVCLGFVLLLLLVAAGCGSNGGGMEDWQTTSVGQTLVNIEGRILSPVSGSVRDSLAGLLPQTAGGGQANATVFVEERPELSAVTDGEGKFLLQNVPVGKWHLIAEIAAGDRAYRQRSDLVSVSSQHVTWQLPSSLQLVYAARSLTLRILNRDSGAAVSGATVTLWGRTVTSNMSGDAAIGPVPSGSWQVVVSAAGYEKRTFLFSFSDTGQKTVTVALTPSTAVDRNIAPTVELSAAFASLGTGGQGSLLATALDPDGDVVQFTWSCTAGRFSNAQGQSTLYTAPAASGTFVIEVTGDDGKGGSGKAAFTVFVVDGSGGPVNPHNQAPLKASSPMPENGASGQSVSPMLRWQASDPDGDALVYDVFLSKLGSPAALIASNIPNPYWQATGLSVYQDYIWHVICRDTSGAINTDYSQWQFKTGDGNNTPPYTPENPTPTDKAQGQLPSILLTWIGGDPDPSDHVTYEVWLATGSQAPLLATTTTFPVARIENLALGTTYSWKIVASDERAGVTTGPTWSFRTYDRPNNPPGDPVAVYPSAGASGVETRPQLRWDATEPDGDAMTYDVFLGTAAPLTCIASGVSYTYLLVPAVLKNNTNYSWQVVAKDTAGLTNANPSVWTFTTTVQANGAPLAPTLNTPANVAANVATQPTLSWTASDPDGDALTYDVFLGLNSTLSTPLVTGLMTPVYVPAALDAGQTYYWKVRASDGTASATSSTNSFTTLQEITADTTAPTLLSVVPAAGAAGVATETSITFTFSEPMSQTSVEQAIALSPSKGYSKTWVSPSILRLTPTTPFRPGAYQIVSLANNSATDLALNKLINGAQAGFTMASDLPLPTSYRSAGFPMTISSGETAVASVPNLGIGRKLLAAVVGIDATASIQISPNIISGGGFVLPDSFKSTPEAAMRELERRLASYGRPHVDGSAPSASIRTSTRVGEEKYFYISSYNSVATTTEYPENVIKARCVSMNDQLYIYVDTSIGSPDYTLISNIRLKFE